jgi:hypothetical protein
VKRQVIRPATGFLLRLPEPTYTWDPLILDYDQIIELTDLNGSTIVWPMLVGGGGAGAAGGGTVGGGGGATGERLIGQPFSIAVGDVFTVTIGAGGIGGSSHGASGGNTTLDVVAEAATFSIIASAGNGGFTNGLGGRAAISNYGFPNWDSFALPGGDYISSSGGTGSAVVSGSGLFSSTYGRGGDGGSVGNNGNDGIDGVVVLFFNVGVPTYT